jgi:hypothetical protein
MNNTEAKNMVTFREHKKGLGQLVHHTPTGMKFSVLSMTIPHTINGVDFPQMIEMKNNNTGEVIFRAPNDLVYFEVLKRDNTAPRF